MKRILTTLIIAALFLLLLTNHAPYLKRTAEGYADLTAVNLSKETDPDSLAVFLNKMGYVADGNEARFIAGIISGRLAEGERLQALTDLRKRRWHAGADDIASLTEGSMPKRLAIIEQQLGYPDLATAAAHRYIPSDPSLKGRIKVKINHPDSSAVSMAATEVRLTEHTLDSLGNPVAVTLGYLQPDGDGNATFNGLDPEKSYSVLPITRGYEYGSEKGTLGGPLADCDNARSSSLSVSFNGMPLSVRLFSDSTLRQMRDEGAMTVRTPMEYIITLLASLIIFLAMAWGVFTLLRRRGASTTLACALTLLCGLGLVTLFAVNDPLTDRIIGVENAVGILIGYLAICVLIRIDMVKFYRNGYRVKFDFVAQFIVWATTPFRFHERVERHVSRWPKGLGYLILAILLTLLLFTPLGAGIAGMRVNIDLGFLLFQPGEIAKYLVIISMSAFFCVRAEAIMQYSRAGNSALIKQKMRMMGSVLIGLVILMTLYLLLGDMGPGLVIAMTFILLYSIVKSKIDITKEGVENYRAILTCDIAMTICGVASFILLLALGNLLGIMGIACMLWFVLWIAGWLVARRRVYESAIFFNLIIAAFIYGGTILHAVGLDTAGERMDTRLAMSTNSWGDLALDTPEGETPVVTPGPNSQVANGLWAVATGGLAGQGLGKGDSQLIPAYHTDMVTESLAEQLGFAGIISLLALFAILLRQTIVIGYRSRHPFTLYLCLGIAIVTGVQLMIILMGSTGIIPLTGVTVPFMSYGKVSLIMNIAAFGIVLSVLSHNGTESAKSGDSAEARRAMMLSAADIGRYAYPLAIISLLYTLITAAVATVFFNYACIDRDDTLIRPAYVLSSTGFPVVEYNPRIAILTRNLMSGDIYDRKGKLLATSDPRKLADSRMSSGYDNLPTHPDTTMRLRRYYPFGDHLFFMVGNLNNGLFFSSGDANPVGYLAEARHLSYLRGYDNTLRDSGGNAVRRDLVSPAVYRSRFLPSRPDSFPAVAIRDYTMLLPLLKEGADSKLVERFNRRDPEAMEAVGFSPHDLHLTIDATLQMKLQENMTRFFSKSPYNTPEWNRLRASIVILSADNGDLLASANYPTPDTERIEQELAGGFTSYSDNSRPADWKAFTDRDLGMTYLTPPGSTAKVVSTIAGFLGPDGHALPGVSYNVHPEEAIERRADGTPIEPVGDVTLEQALVLSSNAYYVNLINDKDLYGNLSEIYKEAGIAIDRPLYYFDPSTVTPDGKAQWDERIASLTSGAANAYRRYAAHRGTSPQYPYRRLNDGHFPNVWNWTWGQGGATGTLKASPLAMARVMSAVANGGVMPATRYTLDSGLQSRESGTRIFDRKDAATLKEILHRQALWGGRNLIYGLGNNIGGKTGTPERELFLDDGTKTKPNDAWYVFYIDNAAIPGAEGKRRRGPLAVAVRIERSHNKQSSWAMELAGRVVVPTLKSLDY